MSEQTALMPGIYDMPEATYHALGLQYASSHRLRTMATSGFETVKYQAENPMEPTPAMALGSAVHCLTLTPDKFKSQFAVAPKIDRRTKAGKEEWENFTLTAATKTVIKQDQYEQAMDMFDQPPAAHLGASQLRQGRGCRADLHLPLERPAGQGTHRPAQGWHVGGHQDHLVQPDHRVTDPDGCQLRVRRADGFVCPVCQRLRQAGHQRGHRLRQHQRSVRCAMCRDHPRVAGSSRSGGGRTAHRVVGSHERGSEP